MRVSSHSRGTSHSSLPLFNGYSDPETEPRYSACSSLPLLWQLSGAVSSPRWFTVPWEANIYIIVKCRLSRRLPVTWSRFASLIYSPREVIIWTSIRFVTLVMYPCCIPKYLPSWNLLHSYCFSSQHAFQILLSSYGWEGIFKILSSVSLFAGLLSTTLTAVQSYSGSSV